MKVTGYQLREALRRHRDRRDMASKQFPESLFRFEDDMKASPPDVATAYQEADVAVAVLEAAQQFYNQQVHIKDVPEVSEGIQTLAYAVKRVGGAGRLVKMWRTAVTDNGKDRWSRGAEIVRQKDEIRAKKAVTPETAMERANAASLYASKLRSAIALANNTEVEIEWLEAKMVG